MPKPIVIWKPWPGAQQRFLTCPVWECLLHGNRGGGKKIPNNSKVLGEKGYVRIDRLSVGDLVYSSDGNLYPVTGIFPQGVSDIYKMTLQDKRVILSGDEHLWKVVDARMKERVLSTIDMYDSGLSYGMEGKQQYKFRIPNCEAVHFQKQILPIDPYILGCLISEGALTGHTPKIATSQQHILDRIKKLYPDFELKHDKSTMCNYTIVDRNKNGYPFPDISERIKPVNRFSEAIRFLGLNVKCHDKFIPKRYKFSSIKQRTELLQGLIDTDGSVGKNGHSEFVSASKRLIKDVAWVCRSLGIRCRIEKDERIDRKIVIRGREYVSGLIYRLYINTSQIISQKPEAIKRLQNKVKSNQEDYVSIVKIEKLPEKTPMTCISVDSPDHTYLIKDFVVTHNTDVLLMDYLQGIGKGYGSDYKGLLLREATTELGDVISKCKKWIPRIFPLAKYNGSKKIWTFPEGESLWLNYARVEADYEQYHGHEYPWIGWEELTNHTFPNVYLKLMSCNRSSNAKIKPKYRSTCNPSGPGHQWVKSRFIDAVRPGKILRENVEVEFPNEKGEIVKEIMSVARTHVKSYQAENKSLSKADPAYMAKIYSLTRDNKMLRKAWIDGSWDLLIGGFFTDVWDRNIHVLDPFKVPNSWSLGRGFDWGSSKPWSVTYAFVSNGEQPNIKGLPYIPKDSIIVPNEIYGWNGTPNEGDQAISQVIAERVLDMDDKLYVEHGIRCVPGPADTSIWEVKDGSSIAGKLNSFGCRWTRAYKGAGSRIAGWALIRSMLGAAKRKDLEAPHLYFFPQAEHHIRTLPLQQRDKLKPEDIDTDLEDHCFVYDTEIETEDGFYKIGDLVGCSGEVLSVNGEFVPFTNCRLVKKNADLIKITFDDLFVVVCTPDHNFLTTNGFVQGRDLLTNSDIKCIITPNNQNGGLLCLKSKELKSSQTRNKNLMEQYIINVVSIFKGKEKDSTLQYMSTIMEKFLKGFTSIIKNQDNIIKLKICNLFQYMITCPCMEKHKTEEDLQKNVLMPQKNGIVVMRAKNGIINIMRMLKNSYIKIMNEFAFFVEKKQRVEEKTPMRFVQTNVNPLGEDKKVLMMLKESVSYVPLHLQSINTQNKKHVVVNADKNFGIGVKSIEYLEEKQDVYCIVAEGTHTFALKNGVVVSNCMDSLRYYVTRKMTKINRRKVGV